MTPNKIVYEIAVRGIFGRNRTPKFSTFSLVQVDIDKPKSVDDLRSLCKAKLEEIKAKPGLTYGVLETPTEVSTSGTGLPTRSFMLCSGKTVFNGTVGGKEVVA